MARFALLLLTVTALYLVWPTPEILGLTLVTAGLAAAAGLAIPSVCDRDHWSKPLSHPDAKVREEGLEALKQSLREAKRYGASSVLLVPANLRPLS